jgi:shikimate 5-dehydrogenase
LQLKVYCIGPDPFAESEALQQALVQRAIPAQALALPTDAVGITRELSQILHDEQMLGAQVLPPFKATALAYCQELTHAAQTLSSVNVMARRHSGLVYGDNTEVHGFTATLRAAGVKRVRTALVLGAGNAAQIALSGLREMNCARYLVGFRNPRRPAELGRQLHSLRKQLSFFPMREMEDFFTWAQSTGLFERYAASPGTSKHDDTIKRWDLLVNATPVGQDEEDPPLISSLNFLRSFERVFDMVPRNDGTALTRAAETAAVAAITGANLRFHAEQQALDLWEREFKRRQLAAEGKLDTLEEQTRFRTAKEGGRPQGRVPVLKRHRR